MCNRAATRRQQLTGNTIDSLDDPMRKTSYPADTLDQTLHGTQKGSTKAPMTATPTTTRPEFTIFYRVPVPYIFYRQPPFSLK